MRRVIFAVLALICAAPAAAQDYPNRPVRIIVPTPAGGPVDVMARLLANALPETLKQSVFIENKPGAGNTLGSRLAAAADPDGYTLMVSAASGLIMSPMIHKNAGYDLDSFTPVDADRGSAAGAGDQSRAAVQDRSPSSSPTPRPIPASSIIRPAAPARCRISPPNCSRSSPASTSCTCPTKAAARR